jgi:hypothetical protein
VVADWMLKLDDEWQKMSEQTTASTLYYNDISISTKCTATATENTVKQAISPTETPKIELSRKGP